jgi:predicted lipoprotein with Yx(FWY)xxD motif
MGAVILLLICGLLLAGCSGGSTPTPVGSDFVPLPTPTAGVVTVNSKSIGLLGTVLTDGGGKPLYQFTPDAQGAACTGQCLAFWPPLVTTGAPQAGSGVEVGMLGTAALSDGTRQVTYNGLPLHRFANEGSQNTGQGQGVHAYGGQWWLVGADGQVNTKQNALP